MNLIVAITGASGALGARLLMAASPWPVTLIASKWGEHVYERECGDFEALKSMAAEVWSPDDLSAPVASGSVPCAGMVILPCSCNTLGQVAAGISDNLITRASHCQLKEQRKLILCVREAPWTRIDLENAARVAGAGGIIMPLSPPYYMFGAQDPGQVNLTQLLQAYVERILALLGRPAPDNWKTVR